MTFASVVPRSLLRRLPALALVALVGAAGTTAAQEPPHSAELDAAIIRAAKRHGVPEHLVRRIVMRESRYNPRARNHSFWGLMQISYPTARSMGFKGTPEQLLNPVTNLTYAVPYLANAFVTAGRREDAAVRLYASGYYAAAKSRGVLGLLRTADSVPMNGVRDEATASEPAVGNGWSLFGLTTPAAAPAVEPAPEASAPQQLAYAAAPSADSAASPAQAQIQAVAHAAPTPAAGSDRSGDDAVAMVPGRNGTMAPPKRWQHDGGTTVIARGDQGAERIAASHTVDGQTSRKGRSRKNPTFAQLDAPAGAAAPTATATDAQPQPTSFYATAMSPGDPTSPAPQDAARQAAAQVAANEAAGTPSAGEPAQDVEADAKGRHRRRGRHHRARD